MKVLLLANYENDRQESMLRFATMLEGELKKMGIAAEVIRPRPFFGLLKRGGTGIGKWLGYLDKFLVFPFQLKRKIKEAGAGCVVHICDHSNAFYTRHLKTVPHVVTCNDLLAVRSALGEFPQNRTGFTGRCLQRWILNGLRRAQRVTCISEATRKDLLRLAKRTDGDVIYMGIDSKWSPMDPEEVERRLKLIPGMIGPYILHVGGDQWYKNRGGVMEAHTVFEEFKENRRIKLVMAGPVAINRGTLFLPHVDDETLRALYSGAELLLFPSIAEGFGWPIVEAQACGCRVVTTEKAPMTEAGGDAAYYVPEMPPGGYYHDYDRAWATRVAEGMKEVLLQDAGTREAAVARGLENAQRFLAENMAQRYVAIYNELLYKA